MLINVGTRARIPNVPGLADARPMTHVEALNLERLPEHLIVLGGGYVGLEFAQAMRRFGSRVTIGLLELTQDEGVDVILDSEVQKAAGRTPNRDQLNLDRAGVEVDALGYIRVNYRLQTTASDV